MSAGSPPGSPHLLLSRTTLEYLLRRTILQSITHNSVARFFQTRTCSPSQDKQPTAGYYFSFRQNLAHHRRCTRFDAKPCNHCCNAIPEECTVLRGSRRDTQKKTFKYGDIWFSKSAIFRENFRFVCQLYR